LNLPEVLEKAALNYGKKVAVVSANRCLSYQELDEYSNKIADYFIELGISKGDRIAILLPNSLEYTVLFFGIIKAGGIAVPLDIKYKDYELTSLLEHCQPTMLISDTAYLEPIRPLLHRFSFIKHVMDIRGDSQWQVHGYQQIIGSCSPQPVALALEPEDTAVIAYTSGPAFHPHGVVLTQCNLVTEARISTAGFQQTDKDISVLFALPLHHVFGLVGILLTAIYCGSKLIIVPGLSLSSLLETIATEKVTVFMGVPYVYTLFINMAQNDGIASNLSSVRLWGSSGAPLSEVVASGFKKYFGKDLINFYGLSEASCHITCPPLNGMEGTDSVGKALPGWEIKIIDDDGHELPAHCNGEILVRGIPIMKGYYHNTEDTTRVLKNGWLHTGDIGRMDNDGYLFITGRKKDMIIRKGQNIYLSDIEYLLRKHPKVADVAVVGTLDATRGEELKAIVVLEKDATATEQEMKQFCLEHIASYKVPRHIIIMDSLPRTASGAVDKNSLQDLMTFTSQ